MIEVTGTSPVTTREGIAYSTLYTSITTSA